MSYELYIAKYSVNRPSLSVTEKYKIGKLATRKTEVKIPVAVTPIQLLHDVISTERTGILYDNVSVAEGQNIKKGVYVTEEQTGVHFPTLLADYQEQLQVLKDGGYWKSSPHRNPCDKESIQSAPCIDTTCSVNVTLDPSESLQSILRSMKDLDINKLKEITRLLRAKYTQKKVLFVTAASSNHFLESQALIHNLHDNVFPYLTNYSFVYYDLGLTKDERSKLQKFCPCEVRTFPVKSMPPGLESLKCYTWKPLIIHANLPTADMLVWMDASVRFRKETVVRLLEAVDRKRISVNWGYFSVADHTKVAMFDYFEEKTCSFSCLSEVEANFLSFKNNRFIREAVTKPWAACALSSNCMCLEGHKSHLMCATRIRLFNKCHRFDQSAIGIILSKLFRGYEVSVRIPAGVGMIKREQKENYFDKLAKNSSAT